MRIIIFSIAFLFLAFSAQSQVLKSAGVWYFLDVDSMTARPAVLPNGTELAYVVGTKTVYYWNRNTNTWTAYGSTFNRDSIYFDSSIIGSGTLSDPWRVDSTLFATITAVGDSIAAALSYVAANYFPLEGGTLTGTGGAGFVGFPSQVSAPGTPASGLNVYAQGSSFNWKGTDGFERQFASTLTGGRTYTLPDISGTFTFGTGTADRLARWTATNTLAAGNLSDNATRLQALLPFQLAAYDLVSLPTGVTKDMYWVNSQGPAWYQGARLAYALESTFARGNANSALYINGNGQITESANYTYTGSLNVYRTSGLTVAQFQTDPAFSGQGWRFKGIASDGRTGLFAYSNNTERRILGARADGAGGIEYLVFGSSGNIDFAGMNASFGLVQNRLYQSGTFFGRGDNGSSLVIAGAGQTTGLGGVLVTQAGSSAGVFDFMTETKTAGSTFGLNRNTMRFTAASFLFNADPAPGGVAFQASRMAIGFYNNRILRNTVFGSTTVDSEPINIIDAKTTARGSRPFPVLTTAQRNALAGKVIAVNMTANGTGYGTTTGYTYIPVTFTGGGGTGAAATAYSFSSGGGVSYAMMTNEGSGYTSAPTVSFGGAGSGATGTAIITAIVDGVGVYNSDTKTYQYNDLLEWVDFGAKQTDDLSVADTIFNTNPATHATVDGFATWKSTAQGYALGKATFGTGLSFSGGVLSATATADGNGIYSGSGTLANHTTRALIPSTGNLFFSQKFNSGADSAYFNIVNYLSGERAVNFGLTDTSSTGYSRGYFEADGAGAMNWRLETSDVNGRTTIRALEGELDLSTTVGNISLSAPVDAEIPMTGLVRAKQEAYYEINSTSSPQNLSNTYSDNFINQGSTQATFTLVFPASPEDGQVLKITYNNNISALTLDGNGNTIVGTTVTTAVEGTQRVFKFYAGEGVWIRQN